MDFPKSKVIDVSVDSVKSILVPDKLPSSIVAHLNSAIHQEYKAHYFYRYAANWCAGVGYMKAAAFYTKEASNELAHAEKLQKYLVDWNESPKLPSINLTGEFETLIHTVNTAYALEFELGVLYDKMSREIFNTHIATFDFLQEFRTIQNESIAEYSDLLNAAQLIDVTSKLDLLTYESAYFN